MKKTVKLQLEGIDGNAYAIMGEFRRAAKRQGWSPAEIEAVLVEAKSGDYDHLLATIIANCEDPYDGFEEDDEV